MSNARKLAAIGNMADEAYRRLTVTVERIGGAGCEVRPPLPADIFEKKFDERSIKLVVKPVAFRLKERASSARAEFIVIVTGQVNFSIDAEEDFPLSCHFETEVAYFRTRHGKAEHVFGIHYDNDRRAIGHPIFHAQMKSNAHFLDRANELLNESLEPRGDRMAGVEGKIRVPTAQMDPFSVFLQLVADHLINVNSDDDMMAIFEDLRTALAFFQSDPARSARLDEVRKLNCFRASHWYPRPVAPGGGEQSRPAADTAGEEAVVATDPSEHARRVAV